MFKNLRKINDLESKIENLREEKKDVEIDLDKLKAEKKREDETIKHLVKMKQEKLELEFEKKQIALESKYQEKNHALETKYNEEMKTHLKAEATRTQKMYSEILQRLPDVNVHLKGNMSGK